MLDCGTSSCLGRDPVSTSEVSIGLFLGGRSKVVSSGVIGVGEEFAKGRRHGSRV